MSEEGKERSRGTRQTRVGRVLSNKMDKTVVVGVETTVMHPIYHRRRKRTSKLYAHDETNGCAIGDEVQIVSCRPLSKLKRWRVQTVLKRAQE